MSATKILDTLLAISRLLEQDQQRELERRGLTVPRTHLLWVLYHGGPATQAHLAEAVGVTPRHVTTLVDALESTGFARRKPHPSDRRAVLVHLTERGLSEMESMDAEHKALGANLIAGLSDDTITATRTALTQILERLTSLVDDHTARAESEERDR